MAGGEWKQEVGGRGCAIPKQENKSRKRKSRGSRNRQSNVEKDNGFYLMMVKTNYRTGTM